MLEMKCIRAMHFEAELRNENDEVLCSSGAVSLRDDDWVCLSTIETAAGDLHKLLSRNMWRAALRVGTGHRNVRVVLLDMIGAVTFFSFCLTSF